MRSKIISMVLCVVMFAASYVVVLTIKNVSAQLTEEWVARYDGPGNYSDSAQAIAVDSSGNIYVTGSSHGNGTGSDYATIKYDSLGNQLWVVRYNGLANSGDDPFAITVGSSGNVYVTGDSRSIGTDRDYATVKYDSNGNQVWAARYDGPISSSDSARAMVIDSSGNIYVTGESYGSGTDEDFATLKYDSSGNEQWVARYNGPGNTLDIANDIAVDSIGNIYVTGSSHGNGTGSDATTIKYDINGNELWVARYNGPGNGSDGAGSIALDSSGNIYVAGTSWGGDPGQGGTHRDFVTIKYDQNGNEMWVARYNGPGNNGDIKKDMFVDSLGNIYVTGESIGSGTYFDYATIKYDPNGNELWVARYNGPANSGDDPYAITLGSSGNVYVTGVTTNIGSANDYVTIAYDSSGNELWMALYNGPGNSQDEALAIALDSSENVYVTGFSIGTVFPDYDYATIKYSQTFLNQPPVADAGSDQIVNIEDDVQFNGSASYDPDGIIVTYEWDFDSSDGLWWETGAPQDAFGPDPTFTYGKYGPFIATLRVTDNNGSMDTDICEITVLAPPLPPVLYINVSKNGEDVVLNWDPPPVLGIDHYLIYRSISQTNFDFNTVWKNTSIDKELNEINPTPLRTMWNDTNAAFPGNATNYNEQYYYTIRAVNVLGEVSGTSRTVGKWTKTFLKGSSTFSLPLEPIESLYVDYCTSSMKADYIKYMNITTRKWMVHYFGYGNTNNTLMKLGEGYEVKFTNQTNYTFTGMPGAMISYDDDNGFSGFDHATEAKNLIVTVEPNGDVNLTWPEPRSMSDGWYGVYYSNTRDGFFGAFNTSYFPVLLSVNFGNNTATHRNALANESGARLYYMVIPFNAHCVRGASTYSIGIWTEGYITQYNTFGLPLKFATKETADWYCDNIIDTVGINFYIYSEQRWCWHSTRMPKEAYDPLIEMTEGYQISTSNHTKYTFIGV